MQPHQDTPPKDATQLKGKTGLIRLFNAFKYSLQGLRAAFKSEAAFREECFLLCLIVPFVLWVPVSFVEKLLLLLTALLVILVELLNSAIEAVVDRIGTDYHELSGRAKDIASAGVLLAMIIMIVTWGAILIRWALTLW